MKKIDDNRWKARLEEVNKNHSLLDLSFIRGSQHHIYYGKQMPQDTAHAERMNVSLHPEEFNDHNLPKYLKGQGRWKSLIESHIRGIA